MSRVKAMALIALMLVVAGQAGASEQSRIFPYTAHVETLDNGLKVVLIPMESEGLVAYWTIVRTGARDEYEPGHTGFAHFFEHMMFRGTERFPAEVYKEMTTKMGADTNAFTSDDLTAYHLSITREDLGQVMQLEADRFRNLAYSGEAFRTEAGAVYGEYRKNRSNPFFTIYEAIHKAAFDVHTYGHTAMGYVEDIKAMPTMFDYSQTFFDRYYRPENCVLLVVGDIDPRATMELAKKHYGDWEPGYTPPQVKPEPEQQGERRIDVSYEGKSLPIVWIGYKAGATDPADPTWVAGYLLQSLAFGETSELYRKLVLDEQVVEFVTGDLDFQRDPKLFNVITRVKDPAKVGYVIEQIDEVVERYRTQAPDPERLEATKSNVKYSFLMGLDTPSNVAGSLARIIAVTGGIAAVDTMFGTFDKVGPEQIREAAEAYLDRNKRTVAILRGN